MKLSSGSTSVGLRCKVDHRVGERGGEPTWLGEVPPEGLKERGKRRVGGVRGACWGGGVFGLKEAVGDEQSLRLWLLGKAK